NGKNLDGWHIMPNHKSVITVTPQGWLNIKGGSGDVQTDAQWGDFTLQLECISNGDHCNSGIFFRSNLNEFEMGYEDQIRNQWEGDDRTKPVDYGTGAIYRRQAVRKVVSSDREWFTMTLIAQGLHFGSWVNGIMVADFTDPRPTDETNARKGARTKPGCLSLQGHDTDGDLSFRNIRVAELPTVAP
ncbi:MAG TPA: DUF1080 domain-containing protein, partial [Chthonomonadaceae bacterium]|nr:DUF1080 domain-containing protein [Chthonomonadaceae bacterium]